MNLQRANHSKYHNLITIFHIEFHRCVFNLTEECKNGIIFAQINTSVWLFNQKYFFMVLMQNPIRVYN